MRIPARLLVSLALALVALGLSACGNSGTNADGEWNIFSGYMESIDADEFTVAGRTYDTAAVTLWNLDGHRLGWEAFPAGMYVQVVEQLEEPFELWVRNVPEPGE